MTVAPEVVFGPGHPEWCPESDDHTHCGHWWDCEPCCDASDHDDYEAPGSSLVTVGRGVRCGDDTPDPHCDCPRCTQVRQEAGETGDDR